MEHARNVSIAWELECEPNTYLLHKITARINSANMIFIFLRYLTYILWIEFCFIFHLFVTFQIKLLRLKKSIWSPWKFTGHSRKINARIATSTSMDTMGIKVMIALLGIFAKIRIVMNIFLLRIKVKIGIQLVLF